MDRNKERSRVRIPAPRRAAASPAAKTGCPRWSRTQVALSNVNRKSFPFAEWCPVGASGETDNKLATGRARPGCSKAWRAHRGQNREPGLPRGRAPDLVSRISWGLHLPLSYGTLPRCPGHTGRVDGSYAGPGRKCVGRELAEWLRGRVENRPVGSCPNGYGWPRYR